MSELQPTISFNAVGVRFGAVQALANLNFVVHAGSINALCGPNGAGKSTALRVVCGLLLPNSGHGQVLGETLDTRPARRRAQIGYMAQRTVLYDELSVGENLCFRAAVMGLSGSRERAHQALREHGLEGLRGVRVGTLSGGWRQRVAFCLAQLARPRLLLLDEPTAGLDAVARAALWRELRVLATNGVTLLVSTHDPAEAALCDGLTVLEQGRVVFSGTPEDQWSLRDLQALRVAAAVGMRVA